MTTIRERAEAILARPDVLQRVEILLRNQLYLDEATLREEIQALGFDVWPVGEKWGIAFPGSGTRYKFHCVTGKEEAAASAIHAMVELLRKKADELEALIK